MKAAARLGAGLLILLMAGCAGAGKARPGGAPKDARGLMMDAMERHLRGEWGASNRSLESCLRLLQRRPEIRLGVEAGAALIDQRYLDYQGEPEELVYLHNLGMLNYAMQGQVEEALVEARRSDAIQRWLKDQGRLRADDPLARIVAAALYLAAGQRDDARIDLESAAKAYERMGPGAPSLPSFVETDLAALRTERPAGPAKGRTRVWLLFFAGHLEAGPDGIEPVGLLPDLEIRLDGKPLPLQLVQDLRPRRQASLRSRGLADAARNGVRVGLRVALVAALAWLSGGEILRGDGAWDFMASGVQADRRFWENLPAQVHAWRVDLKPGKHRLSLDSSALGEPRAAVMLVRPGGPALVRAAVDGPEARLHLSPSLQP